MFDDLYKVINQLPPQLQEEIVGVVSILSVIVLLILIIVVILCIAILIVMIVGRWMLFTKAGQAGWKSIIPFYGTYVYTVEICKCHWVLFLIEIFLSWCFVFDILINSMRNYNLAIKTHQSPTAFIWFTVFGVPLASIMGLCRNSYEYNSKEKTSPFGFFGSKA